MMVENFMTNMPSLLCGKTLCDRGKSLHVLIQPIENLWTCIHIGAEEKNMNIKHMSISYTTK